MSSQRTLATALAAVFSLTLPAAAQNDFVNWETPHVHPLELTPDGSRLVAVNTPDARLEVFDASGGALVHLFDVPVGIDPVSVRARTNDEVWVVNHISDTVSIVDLVSGRVTATLATDDEPADVVFAGLPQRAFVSCSQANTVLVFDPANLAAPAQRLAIEGEDPRALAVSLDGLTVYAAIFESSNGSTVLGGGLASPQTLAFPPNVVSDPAGPYGGVNPPPNGPNGTFVPPQDPNNPAPPRVSLIVKKDAAGAWRDDNGTDWTAFVSGAQAGLSGRLPGWDLVDQDVAMIDTATLGVRYATRLMNICMALAVHPVSGELTVVGTDATNEVRFEPVLTGTFVRVHLARVLDPGTGAPSTLGIADLNEHLDYSTSVVPQSERDRSIGDPRGIAWSSSGRRAYVTGMGSNNVLVLDELGRRAGLAPAIEVGEGPTGLVLDDAGGRLFVLDKFESAISVVDLTLEREVARVPFHDPSPAAVKLGRKHLYDTHKNSGLGQIACASCHVDARMDRLGWDLGAPDGAMKSVAGQNLGANIPGLNTGFQPFHPMKGPMTTQTLQDIIGNEPHHWRGDRDGIEEFAGAFQGLQGDDVTLDAQEMQEFEDFLATITFPPNPFRELDNSLPTNLPLPGHFKTGRFGGAGQPLPDGNPQQGLALYRPPRFLDGGLACSTCHTLPTGMGTGRRFQGGQFVGIAPGPNGERHLALVAVDGTTNVSIKIPHLRNQYEKVGFDTTQLRNTAGFGLLHDGSVDSIARFLSEPAFSVANDQEVADLVAFMLSFTGSDLPASNGTIFEPPGPLSQDTHAAVGKQSTLVDVATAGAAQLALLDQMELMADAGAVGLVVKGVVAGEARGWVYDAALPGFQSDRAVERLRSNQLRKRATAGEELTYTAVPKGSEWRIGVDRDRDGAFDRDELDAGTDPGDSGSVPGGCMDVTPAPPTGLTAVALATAQVNLSWQDGSSNETGFVIERAPAGSGSYGVVASVGADITNFADTTVACGNGYDYRVSATNCASGSGFAIATSVFADCCPLPTKYCTSSRNSTGAVALISAVGSTSVGRDEFTLSAAGTVPGRKGLFLYGPTQIQLPFGDGFRCVGTGGLGLFRLGPPLVAGPNGGVSKRIDLAGMTGPGAITAGSTWNFQYWYRDGALPGGKGFNTSDAVSATFCP